MREANRFAVTLATLTMIVAGLPVLAESAVTKPVATAGSATVADASTNESVLADQLKKVDSAILDALKQASEKYRSTIGWELTLKTLPSKDKVLQTKDAASFREYCGLAEIYLFMDKVADAEALRLWVEKNATNILGAGDVHPKLISSDFGLYYYGHEDYKKAEQMFDHCIKSMEDAIATNPAIVKNQLISAYAAMAEISWKTARKADAAKYVQKVIALSTGGSPTAAPAAVATPAAPATPAAVASPAAPTAPAAPATPAASTTPTTPVSPAAPTTPAAETTTAAPATPAAETTPTVPTTPAAEATPAAPTTPAAETTPAAPASPAPATPSPETTSTTPSTPAPPTTTTP